MAHESEKVHDVLNTINTKILTSGKGMREVSIDVFAALITIVELQQKQIDGLREELNRIHELK
jgi:hypothetical protein